MGYYAILQELPGIKEACILIVRDIIEAAKRMVALSQQERYESELSRFVVEDDGDIHRGEWYDNWQEDESWIRVLSPYMKNGYMLSKYT